MQAAMLPQKLLEGLSLVGGRIVQNNDHLAPQVAQQLAEKPANFFLPDCRSKVDSTDPGVGGEGLRRFPK